MKNLFFNMLCFENMTNTSKINGILEEYNFPEILKLIWYNVDNNYSRWH